jgi:hypothetical protein
MGVVAVSDAVGRLAATLSKVDGVAQLDTIAAARDLNRAVEWVLRKAVHQAREAGHTWQEIGELLGTTRQAAFQRFGRPLDPRTGTPMADAILPRAADRAVELLSYVIAGDWAAACRDFDATVSQRLTPTALAAGWAQLIGMVGGFERLGEPRVYQAGDYTVVDVPVACEAGEPIGRISYDRAGRVAGLHFLRADTMR